MRWSVLGPVQVAVRDRVLPIGRPQQRAVLAPLLLDADRLVSAEHLVAALWADDPPASARTQVQVCVCRIRTALRDEGAADLLVTAGQRIPALGARDRAGPDRVRPTAVQQARIEEMAGRPAEAARLLCSRPDAVARAGAEPVRPGPSSPPLRRAWTSDGWSPTTARRGGTRPRPVRRGRADPAPAGHRPSPAGVVGGRVPARPRRVWPAGGRALRLLAGTRLRLVDELGVEPGYSRLPRPTCGCTGTTAGPLPSAPARHPRPPARRRLNDAGRHRADARRHRAHHAQPRRGSRVPAGRDRHPRSSPRSPPGPRAGRRRSARPNVLLPGDPPGEDGTTRADGTGGGRGRPGSRDLRDRRHGRRRQDRARGALGAPGRRPLPRRAAVRQPARVRPGRARR